MQERLERYKKQALAAIAARANNPAQVGVRAITLSPHDVLKLIEAFEQVQQVESQDAT